MKSHTAGRDAVSTSMFAAWLKCTENGVGDCSSGVDATPPKLETERGESSAERLRLKPMAASVGAADGDIVYRELQVGTRIGIGTRTWDENER